MKKVSLLVLLGILCLAPSAFARDAYPSRPVQVLFPFGPSTTYSVSQIVGEAVSRELGQPVAIASTVGAAGVKAAMTVLSKPSDAYTVLDGFVAPLVLSPLTGNTKYDFNDFEPLYGVASNSFALVCRKDETRWTDLPSLLDYMRENPGKVVYSSGNDISSRNLVLVAMFKDSGVLGRKVTYQDASEMKDFLAKEFDLLVATSGQYVSNKDDIRVLAVLSDQPSPEDGIPGPLPKDYGISLGVKGLAAVGWNWWVVRKGTPEESLVVLREAMYKALSNPETKQKIESLGFSPLDPDQYNPESYYELCAEMTQQLSSAISTIEWMNEQLGKLGQ